MDDLVCEVCENEPAVGVAAVPGVPYSAAYGRQCLEANAHPYHVIVGNTAMIVWGYPHDQDPDDPLSQCADWWQRMVTDTLAHLGKDRETFDHDVQKLVEELRLDDEKHQVGDLGE